MARKRKKRFLSTKRPSEEMTLQITSMADIFTILLVFLLKSFSVGVNNISTTEGLMLPEAHASDELQEKLKIEVSPQAILVDGKVVTPLKDFQYDKTDLESNGTPRSLNTVLINERRHRPQTKDREYLMILADQNTPYATLQPVMIAAGVNGYNSFKLVVVEDQ